MLEIKLKTGKTAWLGDILVALSLSNLMLFKNWVRLFYSDLYWLPTYTWHNYLSATILLLSFSALFLLILRTYRVTEKIIWRLVLLIPAGLAFLFFADAIRLAYSSAISLVSGLNYLFNNLLLTTLLSIVICSLVFLVRKKMISIVYVLLLIFSPFAFLNLFYSSVNITTSLINPPPRFEKTTSVSANAVDTPKTIYIIFDELDYRFLFKDKINSDKTKYINLKNFEYLKQHTLFFTNVKNMWHNTSDAIPALTTGKNVKKEFVLTPYHNMKLTFPNGKKKLWSESDTIFSMMNNANQNVAIIGYHHAYCEIFSPITVYCSANEIQGNFLKSLYVQTIRIIPHFQRLHSIYTHQRIENGTFDALNNNVDFIYVHASIPHLPVIWDASLQRYILSNPSQPNSQSYEERYLNNTHLADEFLGRIIRHMKAKGSWDNSTFIVGTDHRLRIPYDETPLSENIPLLIKFPNQKTGYQYDKEVLPTQIKSMIEQIAINKMHDPVTFMHWLDQQTAD